MMIIEKLGFQTKKDLQIYIFFTIGQLKIHYQKKWRRSKTNKKIEVNTLDNIIKESKIKIKEIDFLTIDVEGNELNVLQGLNFKKI